MAKKELNIALIGTKFMGKAHSNGLRQVARFFDLPVNPVMKVLCGRDKAGTQAAAQRLGWQEWSTDWKDVVNRDDIHVIDIATPGDLHKPIALAAAKAGKHIICEKPLANTLPEAKAMLDAVRNAPVKHMCGFSYRFAPAVASIKNMIRAGQLGQIFHFRAAYQQDWIVDPEFPLVWRLQKEHAGSGALGDIGAHIIDMCHNLVGPIEQVAATTQTFITERPIPESDTGIDKTKRAAKKARKGKVTVDDAAIVLARIKGSNTLATFEATRFAPGRRNHHVFEIYGSKGSVVWDLEHMNFFQYYNNGDPGQAQGFRLVNATDPGHPYANAWWPPAHIIGYEHLFTHEFYDFFTQLTKTNVTYPTFHDGLACQAVLDAVARAAKTKKWEKV